LKFLSCTFSSDRRDCPRATHTTHLPGLPLGTSTFLWIVLGCVESLQALIQYVKHLSAQINENQGQSSHGHLAKTKKGLTGRQMSEPESAAEAVERLSDQMHSVYKGFIWLFRFWIVNKLFCEVLCDHGGADNPLRCNRWRGRGSHKLIGQDQDEVTAGANHRCKGLYVYKLNFCIQKERVLWPEALFKVKNCFCQ